MLYGNESISQYTRAHVTIWMLMAFQAGLINIGGFMACHRFVSHVTGFATFFGYEINQHDPQSALSMLSVPLFFLLGCMLSGFLVDIRLKLHKRPKYYISFGLIFFLLLLILILGTFDRFGRFGEPFEYNRDYFLLATLCLICGIQNATITSVSRSVVRTTHLTGITTDLGVGLVRFLNRKKLREQNEYGTESEANLMRIGIISFFVLGSLLGGFIFSHIGFLGFAVPAFSSGILFLTMYYFQFLKVRS